MSTFTITEYEQAARDGMGVTLPVPLEPALAVQQITLAAGSVACANAFQPGTRFLLIECDARSAYKVAAAPTAAITDTPVAASAPRFIGVRALIEGGIALKIAAILNP